MGRQGNFDEAVIRYNKALELQPRNAETRLNLAIVLQKQGKPDEAIEQYREVLRISPAHARARKALDAALERQADSGPP